MQRKLLATIFLAAPVLQTRKAFRSSFTPILPPERSFLINKCYRNRIICTFICIFVSNLRTNIMKYKFQVMVALTYSDKDIEVEVPLSDKEVAKIKQLIAENNNIKEEPEDEEEYVPSTDLLQILEDNDEELFKKFWNVIMPPVFIEMLINGLDNGHIEQHDDDDFFDYYEADFDEVYDMYGDDIELEHSSCCICRIPEDWLPK